ncbi:hypothetical protein Mapa_003770 [Marchantia paleacea]|nr:hypothetical protein Mapa_003770 [Marchantia paleacea]
MKAGREQVPRRKGLEPYLCTFSFLNVESEVPSERRRKLGIVRGRLRVREMRASRFRW